MTFSSPLFPEYEAAVRAFNGVPCSANLLLAQEGSLSVYNYAPFEWVNRQAKVVLVGITPGRTQDAGRQELANQQGQYVDERG